MRKDIKEKWIKALKGGDYSQVKQRLHTTEGFCCLGVLTELAVQDGVVLSEEWIGNTKYYDNACGYLPSAVAEWSGFDSDKHGYSVMTMNDDEDKSFNQIADYIEEYV